MFDTLKKIPLTFYSRSFYSDLVRQGTGIGAAFIGWIVIIGFLGFLVHSVSPLQHIAGQFQDIIRAMPVVTIKDKKISIDQPAPYLIKVPSKAEAGKPEVAGLIVIDPGFVAPDLDSLMKKMQTEHIVVLVTADKFITLAKSNEVKVNKLNLGYEAVITHERWEKVAQCVGAFMLPFIAIFVFIGLIIKNFIGVVIGAVLVKIMSLFSAPDFSGSMRLAAAASIPPAILFTFAFPSFWASFAVWLGYTIFGLWSYRRSAAG